MKKPAYFVLDLKLAPSPVQNLKKVIAEIDRKLESWARSQDPSLNELVLSIQTLKTQLQGPNGREVWNAEIQNAREFAEERFNSLLQVFRTSRFMTES